MKYSKLKDTDSEVRLEVVIGKDILELLSSSMYVEPLTIYREYVQNAADAIDEAVAEGLLADSSEGRIEIFLDHIGRRALIRDNGIGVSADAFKTLLTSFGASHKRGTSGRGFRGVGRLAGLGYCQELIFRSRVSSDFPVQELKWDCRRLKKFLTDSSYAGNLQDIVSEIVTFSKSSTQEFPDRFFEVEIIKPRRIGADVLLNEAVIESYLGQVAPVPFSPKFKFADTIRGSLEEAGLKLEEYDIRINEAEQPVYRPFADSISYSETKTGQCQKAETFSIFATDGELAAVGWLLHHDYQGAIPESLGVRGFRARVGNIQVGGERLFVEIFPEDRFNSWTVGEVHVIDRRIIPNGRRDDFEQNTHFSNFTNHLAPQAGKIARQCRSSSQIRNRIKTFEIGAEKIEEALGVLEQGAVSKKKAKELRKEIGTKLREIQDTAVFDLLYEEDRRKLNRKANKLERKIEALSNVSSDADPLVGLPTRKRAVYTELFDLIYECSVNWVAAKALVDRILAKIHHA